MAKPEVLLTDSILLTTLKARVFELYGRNSQYDFALKILQARKPQYTFDDLVTEWQAVYDENLGEEFTDVQSVYLTQSSNSSPSYGRSFPPSQSSSMLSFETAYFGGAGNQSSASPSKDKKRSKNFMEIQKDKFGKNICFTFLRTGACEHGSKCKYSHNVDKDLAKDFANAAFDSKEFMEQAFFQMQQNAKAQFQRQEKGKYKKHYKKKFQKFKAGYSKVQGNGVPNKPTGSGKSYQQAVRDYDSKVKRSNGEVPAKANVADADEQVSDSSSFTMSSDSELYSSDNPTEHANMVTGN